MRRLFTLLLCALLFALPCAAEEAAPGLAVADQRLSLVHCGLQTEVCVFFEVVNDSPTTRSLSHCQLTLLDPEGQPIKTLESTTVFPRTLAPGMRAYGRYDERLVGIHPDQIAAVRILPVQTDDPPDTPAMLATTAASVTYDEKYRSFDANFTLRNDTSEPLTSILVVAAFRDTQGALRSVSFGSLRADGERDVLQPGQTYENALSAFSISWDEDADWQAAGLGSCTVLAVAYEVADEERRER